MVLDLRGKGAIVAGTRRLGGAVVRKLAAEGVRLAIVYRSSEAEANALAREVTPLVDRVCLLQADLTVEAEVGAIVEQARYELGDLSFSVNLASDYPSVPLSRLDANDWEAGLAAAKATYLLAVHSARVIRRNASGRTRGQLIFCGDWAAGATPYRGHLPYLTGKAAIHFLTRVFARELAEDGILVNALAPGPTLRPSGLDESAWRRILSSTPLGRSSSAEDMAEMVATLLKSETITGEVIRVDSGRHVAGFP
ncbi:SDR family oxidoreductase [Streptomyces lavendulae]|uniref:SDR family oxidoreductase n=1 Tax=Streptomyces lavendulae TaxID=1914 RepID=UPI0024A10D65|nr:SDR family oxidoreductase [Streptomyces lavendulae]GLW04724.1 dehydrogenase [Streptomyces lavendulae subsp. lavendulae]